MQLREISNNSAAIARLKLMLTYAIQSLLRYAWSLEELYGVRLVSVSVLDIVHEMRPHLFPNCQLYSDLFMMQQSRQIDYQT